MTAVSDAPLSTDRGALPPVLFSLPADMPLSEPLCAALGAEQGAYAIRHFPDGETYLRVEGELAHRRCVILADLARPDDKFLPVSFLISTLRELGARSVGLVVPYLPYMRQDRRFAPGEALTSRMFARLLSRELDWLVTVDPHLHRYHSLNEVYDIPATAVQGAPVLADWLGGQAEPLLLVGPDSESEQWVSAIAEKIGQPFVVGSKERRGDRDVTVTLPDLSAHEGRTAVVVDDVVSSGHTLLDAVHALQQRGFDTIDCATVHGIFAGGADQRLRDAGVRRLITANTIPHASNRVDLSGVLARAVQAHLGHS